MKTSPTQRSLKLLRDAGYHAAITEHWNQFAHIRQDLFGFCDIVAYKPSGSVLFVQTTSGSNLSARVAKIVANEHARAFLQGEGREIVVHGWRKVGARGKRKLWDCRVTHVTLDDFPKLAEPWEVYMAGAKLLVEGLGPRYEVINISVPD